MTEVLITIGSSLLFWAVLGVVSCLIVNKWASFFDNYKCTLTVMLMNYVIGLSLQYEGNPFVFYAGYYLLGVPFAFLVSIVAVYFGRHALKYSKTFFNLGKD
ncbi:conserved membrane hypothetical protein [Candidatus Liberibacter solanacearum]|uniref:hypothetical protein n=1 Tax=Candidatus Liberibacter solanacearum TaxID=556287 RepID=UPI0038721087